MEISQLQEYLAGGMYATGMSPTEIANILLSLLTEESQMKLLDAMMEYSGEDETKIPSRQEMLNMAVRVIKESR